MKVAAAWPGGTAAGGGSCGASATCSGHGTDRRVRCHLMRSAKAPARDRVGIEESRAVVVIRNGIPASGHQNPLSARLARPRRHANKITKHARNTKSGATPPWYTPAFHGPWPPGRLPGHASLGRAQHRQRRSRRAPRRVRRARPAVLAPRLRLHPAPLAPRSGRGAGSHAGVLHPRVREGIPARSTIPPVHDSARSCGRAWTAFSRTSIRPRPG